MESREDLTVPHGCVAIPCASSVSVKQTFGGGCWGGTEDNGKETSTLVFYYDVLFRLWSRSVNEVPVFMALFLYIFCCVFVP